MKTPRTREKIEQEATIGSKDEHIRERVQARLQLEVLLDIRDLLQAKEDK